MIIYKTTNLINGKFYIGQDSNNNPNYYGSGLLLEKAIKKYGKHNFIKEIIEYCNSKEDLDKKEIFYIKKYDSINNGYNLSFGGTGGPNFLGRSHSEDAKIKMKMSWDNKKKDPNFTHNMTGFRHSEKTKKKYSEIRKGKLCGHENPMYGKIHTEEAKLKMSNPKFGPKNPMYGKTHTEETKRKISEKTTGKNNPMYGKKHTEKSKQKIKNSKKNPLNSKKVNVDGVTYGSIMEAYRITGFSMYLIRSRCRNDKHKWFFI